MATIKLSQSHSLAPEVARERVSELFDAYKSRFGINSRWEGNTVHLSGSGFDGQANIGADRVDVEVKLGFAVSMFKGQVESGLKTELEKRLKT